MRLPHSQFHLTAVGRHDDAQTDSQGHRPGPQSREPQVPSPFELGEVGLRDAETLGEFDLGEARSPSEACEIDDTVAADYALSYA